MADVSKLKGRSTLGAPPPLDEASNNLSAPEVAPVASPAQAPAAASNDRPDGRSTRRTNRTVQFATRVTPEFDRRVRAIAASEGRLLVEILERALDLYENRESR